MFKENEILQNQAMIMEALDLLLVEVHDLQVDVTEIKNLLQQESTDVQPTKIQLNEEITIPPITEEEWKQQNKEEQELLDSTPELKKSKYTYGTRKKSKYQ